MDWVSNKLYWVDASWARIEALDLYSNERVEVLLTGTNTAPRAIAVDPINRCVYNHKAAVFLLTIQYSEVNYPVY